MTREYSTAPPGNIPPAQWGEVYGRASDDGCAVPDGDDSDEHCPQATVTQPDELHDAHSPIAHFSKHHW